MRFVRVGLMWLFLSTGYSYAQTDFRPGYIIKSEGDTLYGEIDYRGDLIMSSVCKFKDAEGLVSQFYPWDISAYRFTGDKYYVSREVNGKKVFLEYLINGKVNIYYMRDEAGDHYYLDKEDIQLTEIPYEEGEKVLENRQVRYESKRHMGLLHYYMRDAPDFETRVQTVRKPDHNNLIKLAEDYHNAVCEDEKCIIYEKKQAFLKINPEVVFGVINFEKRVEIIDKYYMHGGVIANIRMPRVNEKLYIRTGILYAQVENEEAENLIYLQVPFHFGYMAPQTYRIRPSVSIGLFSPSYAGGVAVRINKSIHVGVQSWVNFHFDNILWIPSELYNYSFLGNIYIQF